MYLANMQNIPPIDGDRIKKQRFWYLLERNLTGTCNKIELAEFDKMADGSREMRDTIALVNRLWRFDTIDEMEQMIRQELADDHEKKYIWAM